MVGKTEMQNDKYSVLVRPLSAEDGGGWLASVPDLPGCMSDGETMQEAIENVTDAIQSWKEAAQELGRAVPAPGASRGEWRQRVPRTVHYQLTELARREGVSLNTLVATVLAEYIGRAEVGASVTRAIEPFRSERGGKPELAPAD
jgi:antitoxin HicB